MAVAASEVLAHEYRQLRDKSLEEPFEGVRIAYDLNRLRLLGKFARKQEGEFSSEQARAFVLLHGAELEERLHQTVRDFLKEKL